MGLYFCCPSSELVPCPIEGPSSLKRRHNFEWSAGPKKTVHELRSSLFSAALAASSAQEPWPPQSQTQPSLDDIDSVLLPPMQVPIPTPPC